MNKKSIMDLALEERNKIMDKMAREKAEREAETQGHNKDKITLTNAIERILQECKKIPGVKIKDGLILIRDHKIRLYTEWANWKFRGSDDSPEEDMCGWQLRYEDGDYHYSGHTAAYIESFEKALAAHIGRLLARGT